MTERPVKRIAGVHALAQNAALFVMPQGNGEVVPAHGAVIVEISGGKYLVRLFNGERWIKEVLKIRTMMGVPTLVVASN